MTAKGSHPSTEHRKHIGEGLRNSPKAKVAYIARRGKPLSMEHRQSISEGMRISQKFIARQGKTLSETHRKRIGESRKGKPLSEKQRAAYERRRGKRNRPLTEKEKAYHDRKRGRPLTKKEEAHYEHRRGKPPTEKQKIGYEKCRGKVRSEVQRKNMSEAFRNSPKFWFHLQNMLRKGTKIELILRSIVDDFGVPYETNIYKNYNGVRTFPDIFIKPNICLEAYGEYYHNLEYIKQKDEKVNAARVACGVINLRFWGYELENNSTAIKERIRQMLEEQGIC